MNDVNWEEAYKLTERLRDENTRLRSVNAQLLAALKRMMFESVDNSQRLRTHKIATWAAIEQAETAIASAEGDGVIAESEPKP